MRTKKVTLPTAGAFTSLADYGLVYHGKIITPQRGFKESGFLCIAFIVLDGAKVREKRSDNPARPCAYSLRHRLQIAMLSGNFRVAVDFVWKLLQLLIGRQFFYFVDDVRLRASWRMGDGFAVLLMAFLPLSFCGLHGFSL